ncbi:STAS domain-containing protein [Streptomyces sp. NPDC059564]|uniref:STAS domain-containing protein n=1 Tax=Streptomyces sp. NPDC059564 TaxID=3346865 RepID=UPI0036BEB78D
MPVRIGAVSATARVLHCEGEFDLYSVAALLEAAGASSAGTGPSRLVIDVSAVGFADSAFLNCLLWLRRTTPCLVLAGTLPKQLRRLLEITETLPLFTYAPDVEAAGP